MRFGIILASVDEIARALDRVDDEVSPEDMALVAERLEDAASRVKCLAACLRADELAGRLSRSRQPRIVRGAA